MTAPSWLRAAILVTPAVARAEEAGAAAAASMPAVYRAIGLGVAVTLTMVGSIVAAAWAVGRIGAAILAAAAEKPEVLTRSLVYLALAEGLAVLGFAVSVMMLQKL